MKSPCRFLSRAQTPMILVALFCLLLIPLLLTTAMAKNNTIATIEGLIDQGKYARASARLAPLLQQQPKHLAARFLQARVLFAEGDPLAAQQLLQALLREQPKWPEIHNNLAVIYASQGDFNKARRQLEKALATHPGYQAAYDNLAMVYERLASQAYRQALSPDESLVLPNVQLAMIGHLPLPQPVVVKAPVKIKATPMKVVKQPIVTSKQDKKMITAMVKGWAQAWSAQKPERYLGYYDDNFKPRAGVSREDWAAKRRVRLRKPQYIRVKVDNIEVTTVDKTVATVFLRQNYQSDRMNDSVVKHLIVRKSEGKWRIFQESLVR